MYPIPLLKLPDMNAVLWAFLVITSTVVILSFVRIYKLLKALTTRGDIEAACPLSPNHFARYHTSYLMLLDYTNWVAQTAAAMAINARKLPKPPSHRSNAIATWFIDQFDTALFSYHNDKRSHRQNAARLSFLHIYAKNINTLEHSLFKLQTDINAHITQDISSAPSNRQAMLEYAQFMQQNPTLLAHLAMILQTSFIKFKKRTLSNLMGLILDIILAIVILLSTTVLDIKHIILPFMMCILVFTVGLKALRKPKVDKQAKALFALPISALDTAVATALQAVAETIFNLQMLNPEQIKPQTFPLPDVPSDTLRHYFPQLVYRLWGMQARLYLLHSYAPEQVKPYVDDNLIELRQMQADLNVFSARIGGAQGLDSVG